MKKSLHQLAEWGKNGLWTRTVLLLSAILLGLIPLWFACVVDRKILFISYFQTPLIAFLNLLPVLILVLVLFLLTNRAWIAGLLGGLCCLAIGFINYYKITFRNEPLNFEDLTLFREAGNMTQRGYSLFLNRSMIAAILLVVLVALFLKFFARGRLGGRERIITGVIVLLLILPLSKLYANEAVYKVHTANIENINQWAESQVYYSKGLVYPFLHSMSTYSFPVPANYNELAAKDWLASYEDVLIPEGQQVDVMAVMLEAYSDFDRLGLEGLSEDVYAKLHEIEAESISGHLIVNVFAGDTINTERAFLSGLVYLPTFRGATNAYPWYFKQSGYHTEGAHASYSWFYNRQNINYNLGFEEYYFLGDEVVGASARDEDFLVRLEERYRAYCAENDAPYFAYHLTYQGHGPYPADRREWPGTYFQGDYAESTLNILNNYFGSVQNTMENFAQMLESLQDYDRPLVIVAFGDHMPWLGDAAGIYQELGINLDLGTPEGHRNYYSTPYFIWANDEAREVLGRDFSGDGGEVAPCFLMNKLFAACGWTGPAYLQAANEVMAQVPVPTDKGVFFLADGSATVKEPDIISPFLALQYYYQSKFTYQGD